MIAVIGCGASGMLAAITAARAGASVTVLEHNDKPGRKLLATGNGKCNLTNDDQSEDNFRGSDRDAIRAIVSAFSKDEELRFFEEIGIPARAKRGYYYPKSEQAVSVVSALACEMDRLRVRVLYGADVTAVFAGESGGYRISYHMQCGDGEIVAEKVIFACGGPAGDRLGQSDFGFRVLRKMGIPVRPYMPALVPLTLNCKELKEIAGVRMPAEITLSCGSETHRESGEIVWTEYGISGIPVMQLSRFAALALWDKKSVEIAVDCTPEYSEEDLFKELVRRTDGLFANRDAVSAFDGMIPGKLLKFTLARAGITADSKASSVSAAQCSALAREWKELTLPVTGTKPFANAQVTCGGIPLSAVDPVTCEAIGHPGLYITGELLDMDGNCGGYNLQWAFATGVIAGRAAGKA